MHLVQAQPLLSIRDRSSSSACSVVKVASCCFARHQLLPPLRAPAFHRNYFVKCVEDCEAARAAKLQRWHKLKRLVGDLDGVRKAPIATIAQCELTLNLNGLHPSLHMRISN